MDKQQQITKRWQRRFCYALATAVLLAVEVVMALYVHDTFFRPYVGDVLAVVVVYTFVRSFVPDKLPLLPLYVFLFAAGVELLQLLRVVEWLQLENNRFLRVLIGMVFDGKDILCYAVGCSLLGVFERQKRKGGWK